MSFSARSRKAALLVSMTLALGASSLAAKANPIDSYFAPTFVMAPTAVETDIPLMPTDQKGVGDPTGHPDLMHGNEQTSSGPMNPATRQGFNPQPDPPGVGDPTGLSKGEEKAHMWVDKGGEQGEPIFMNKGITDGTKGGITDGTKGSEKGEPIFMNKGITDGTHTGDPPGARIAGDPPGERSAHAADPPGVKNGIDFCNTGDQGKLFNPAALNVGDPTGKGVAGGITDGTKGADKGIIVNWKNGGGEKGTPIYMNNAMGGGGEKGAPIFMNNGIGNALPAAAGGANLMKGGAQGAPIFMNQGAAANLNLMKGGAQGAPIFMNQGAAAGGANSAPIFMNQGAGGGGGEHSAPIFMNKGGGSAPNLNMNSRAGINVNDLRIE